MSDFKIVSVLNPTVVLTGGPVISAGASSQSAGTIVFSNSNGVSFGLSNGTMTASAVGGGGGGGVAISAGTNSTSTGTVVFSNSNGVSFGMDTNGVITGTVATNYQSQGAYLTTAMASNRGTDFVQATAAFAGTNASGTIASNGISVSVAAPVAQTAYVFSNSNGVSFGTVGSTVTATVKTDYLTTQTVQTQASGNIAGIGFTSTTTAGTAIVGTNSTNGLSLGVPAFITTYVNDLTSGRAGTGFTSTTTAGTAVTAALGTNGLSMAVPNFITTFAAQTTQTQASGAIAGTGFTSTTTAGTAVTAALGTNGLSMAVPQFITTYVNDLTSGRAGTGFTSTTTAGTAVAATLSTNGLSMGVPAFLTTAMQSGASTQFVQANANFFGTNASGTIASNAISISVNAGGPGGGGVAISAGTNSTSTGTVVFSNSNGVSFGMDTNGVVTATVKTDYLTTQSVQTQASGNIAGIGLTTTTTAGTAVVGTNSTNGLSLGIPAFITTFAAQTTQTQASGNIAGTGFTSTTTTGTAIVGTNSTNGLSLGVPAFITTYVNDLTSGRAGTGFTSTTTAGTAVVATLSTNGLSMAVPQFLTTAMASNRGTDFVQANANFFGTNASGTIASNAISISVNAGGGGGAGTNTALALTNLTGTLSVNTNGVSLSLQNLDDHFSAWSLVGNTDGANSYSLSTEGPLVLEGGPNVTLSGNSNTIVFSAGGGVTNQTGPNIAAGGATATSGTVIFSNSNNITFGLNGQTMTASYADPTETIFYRPNDFITTVGNPINASASVFYCPIDHNLSATRFDVMASVSVTTAGNTSSAGVLWSLTACMYTLNGQTLSSVSSAATNSEFRWQSNSTGSVTGALFFSAPLNINANADKYWMAVQLSTRATGLTGAATTSLGNSMSMFGVGSAQIGAFSAHDPGQATANSYGWYTGLGMYSGTTNFSTIGLSNLTQAGTNAQRANLGIRMRG